MELGLQSRALSEAGFAHAFFTRGGGVSKAPYASLSFSTAGGDDPADVLENRRRAAASLGVDESNLFYLSQVHGVGVVQVRAGDSAEALLGVEGDVTCSRDAGVACGVRTADCVAVLVADPASGAVAAIHSGWRGTVQNVVAAGVEKLRELTGPAPHLIAAVGPHIEACCFEIGDDVAREIADSTPLGESILDRSRDKPHADLRRVVERQLRDADVAVIDHVRGCTVCDDARFHSYRRGGRRSGRMLAAIVPSVPA